MKILFIVLLSLSIIPVSIIGMMYGWGIQPENWGWISFSYVWMMVMPIILESMKD